ncbi:MAG: FlxA-like family protein [Xylophilus ampelinus]
MPRAPHLPERSMQINSNTPSSSAPVGAAGGGDGIDNGRQIARLQAQLKDVTARIQSLAADDTLEAKAKQQRLKLLQAQAEAIQQQIAALQQASERAAQQAAQRAQQRAQAAAPDASGPAAAPARPAAGPGRTIDVYA